MKKRKIIGIAMSCLLSASALICGGIFLHQYRDVRSSAAAFNELAGMVAEVTLPELSEPKGDAPSASEAELAQEKYSALFEQNNDFVGWISIDGTDINYPVMQTPDHPDYYLKHGFDKAYSNYGVPYIDEACAPGLSNNIVIYGHHMNDGSMFANLCGYADRDFWAEHKTIHFDTLSSFGEYEVMAAFRFNANRDTFRYNEYTNMDEAEFAEFLENVRARALYDTGAELEYGDTLLTLSTCEYTYRNGRFVVVAKKVN